MDTKQLAEFPKDICLERLVDACNKRGLDVHDILARCMSPEGLVEGSGINDRWQGNMAWTIIDKSEPNQTAIKHSGEVKQEVRLIIEG